MSDTPETDTLLVYVRREVREVVSFTVPKGWKPTQWDVVQILNEGEELPKYGMAYWDPAVVKAWPDAWKIVQPGEPVRSPYEQGPQPTPGIRFDAREIIAKMPPAYDPEELRELQEQGAKVWADVPDAAAWVRDLRGGTL